MGAAEQQQFSQYPLRYGDGTLGAAIAQTRDGKDELITPVALWELDDSSGLYLPPGLSQNPRRPRVDAQLSGRNAEIITLVDAVAVADTNEHLSSYLSTLDKYRDYEIFVTNSHNQPVYIGFKYSSVYPRVVNSDGSLSDYNRWGKAHIVPAGARRVALSQVPLSGTNENNKFPYKAFRQPDFRIAYQFVTAPTSGAISIWLVGILN